MITEFEIDKSIALVEKRAESENEAELIAEEEFVDYLGTEIIPNLTEYENHVLSFCISVIYNVVSEHNTTVEFDIEEYQNSEEKNWSARDNHSKLEESINLFFDGYKEEDLLAFVEDMIAEDDPTMMSIAGREIIFITCKSYIDVVC